jgi:exosortase/archaeosortase family protein
LRCTVTAACSGLRTIIACGALAVLLRKWRLIPLALAGGFLLNLARVVVVELLCRVDVPFGMMVHDLALFLVVLPIGLFAVTLYRQLSHAGRSLVQAYTLMLSGILLAL